jgi:hypothetical protein
MKMPSKRRLQRRVLGGEGFDAGEHDAVGDDQRNEDAEHQIQLVQIGVEQQVDDRDQRGDDQDEDRDADFVRDEIAQAGDGDPEIAMTMMVASESMTPLTALVVTASNGQRPRIWTMLVFCFQMPLPAMVLEFFTGDHLAGSLCLENNWLRLASAHLTALNTALVTARGVTVAPA